MTQARKPTGNSNTLASPEVIISAHHVGKSYRTYNRSYDRLIEWLSFDKTCRHHSSQVLEGIDFEIRRGESVAIIGRNGAGKSTLLKVLSGVISPTEGECFIKGRTTALLELGMGFHPEFTGRQNIQLSGNLMGLSDDDIERTTPWIESFADIGEAINDPVRTYSSGMQMRLAFAVATAVRPDVLIIDEALSVGDVFFQQRCFDLIDKYRSAGTTLLFVTHALDSIPELCERALYLDKGQLIFDGDSRQAIQRYEADFRFADHENAEQLQANLDEDTGNANGSLCDEHVQLISCEWQVNTLPQRWCEYDDHLELCSTFLIKSALRDLHAGILLKDKRGRVLYETNTYCQDLFIGDIKANQTVAFTFAFKALMVQGEYTVTVTLASQGYGTGAFRQQHFFAHGQAPLQVIRPKDYLLWDGLVNFHPICQAVIK